MTKKKIIMTQRVLFSLISKVSPTLLRGRLRTCRPCSGCQDSGRARILSSERKAWVWTPGAALWPSWVGLVAEMTVTAEWDGAESEWEPGQGTPGDRHCFPTVGRGLQGHQGGTPLSLKLGTRGWWRGGARLGYGREHPVGSSLSWWGTSEAASSWKAVGDQLELGGDVLEMVSGPAGCLGPKLAEGGQRLCPLLRWPATAVEAESWGCRPCHSRSHSAAGGPQRLSRPLCTVTGPWTNPTLCQREGKAGPWME